MIARIHRFHGRNSLRAVYQRGQTVRCAVLSVKYLQTSRQSYRAAVVVSRKVHKSAVVRNRIRRRMYEFIRTRQRHLAAPYDIVVTAFHESIATMPAEELDVLLTEQFTKAELLKTQAPANSTHDIVSTKERL